MSNLAQSEWISTRYRYLFWGIAFGACFPLVASVLSCQTDGRPFTMGLLGELHGKNPLLMIIDLAPIVLGIFAYFLGRAAEKSLAVQSNRRRDAERYLNRLQVQNQELHTLNETLDSLLYTASHDLKTPIVNFRSLIMMMRQMEKMGVGPEQRAEILERLDATTDKFENTINDLLYISQIDAQFEEGYSVVSIQESVRQAMGSISDLIRNKEANIQMDFSEIEQVHFPPRSLQQIMTNLLSNALNYSSPDRIPEISVFARVNSQREVEIGIQDNGIGIDLERNREKLFKMFKRLHNHSAGSGLGLYIVKRIIDKSGGNIEVESAPGKGTLFTLFIPQPELQ